MKNKLEIELYDGETGRTTDIIRYNSEAEFLTALTSLLQSGESNFEANIPKDHSNAQELTGRVLEMFLEARGR